MPRKLRRERRGHYAPLLYPILDGFDAIGVGITKGYELVNAGVIETVVIGRRRYATRESLERLATPADRQTAVSPEALITSLPPVVTPTIAKAVHDELAAHRRPRPKAQEEESGAAE
ncbi:MAG TPA: hypothetical protein VKC66_13505 [Xanthobacteraceae bacterium]|nr:hypothetical protein [Xanthobacteraceae bacterium]